MAERRMFTQKIIDSDAFLDMPLSTQSLYFHLNMRADDDGFVNNPKKIQRMVGASEDDLKLLIAKRFILAFENGVIVIKHWRMHNLLRKDRYSPTQYVDQMNRLEIKDNGAYTEKEIETPIPQLATEWQPNGNQMATQDSIGKDRLDKVSIGKVSIGEDISDSDEPKPPKSKPTKHKYGEYNNVLLTDDELQKLKTEYSDYEERIERLSSYVASTGKSYKSHYATIRNWARKEPVRKEVVPSWMNKPNKFHNYQQRDTDYDKLTADNDPLMAQAIKTAANDKETRERAEALKRQLRG